MTFPFRARRVAAAHSSLSLLAAALAPTAHAQSHEPLEEIVDSGKVPAQRLLDKFHGEWGGDIGRVYEESF